MKRLNEIQDYMNDGYILMIERNSEKDICAGSIVLYNGNRELVPSILDMHEVKVEKLMQYFLHIKNCIGDGKWLEIYEGMENPHRAYWVIRVVQKNYHGPYAENPTIDVVDDLSIENESLFSGLVELNTLLEQKSKSGNTCQKSYSKKLVY